MNGGAVMTTADGVPLKVSLARARRRNRNRALVLVAPLFAFIVVTFFIPIVSMLFRSVENDLVAATLPRTVPLLAQWDETRGELPDEAVFAALAADFVEARKNKTSGRVGRRLNYEQSGFSSMFRGTARTVGKLNLLGINKLIDAENPCHYISVRDAILDGSAQGPGSVCSSAISS